MSEEKKFNLMDLDFENTISQVVITGGKDGIKAQVHYKNSDRVDCHCFVKQREPIAGAQGTLN